MALIILNDAFRRTFGLEPFIISIPISQTEVLPMCAVNHRAFSTALSAWYRDAYAACQFAESDAIDTAAARLHINARLFALSLSSTRLTKLMAATQDPALRARWTALYQHAQKRLTMRLVYAFPFREDLSEQRRILIDQISVDLVQTSLLKSA